VYSSAIVMRRDFSPLPAASAEGRSLPIATLTGLRLAYNALDSMSGRIALQRDLEAQGSGHHIFSGQIETGGHRASIRAVALGKADLAAVDCKTWSLTRKYEPLAQELTVIGWTSRRKGLPYITAASAS
jgi:ABC-type phosphate/phosphonate transport system substrate-binding protein